MEQLRAEIKHRADIAMVAKQQAGRLQRQLAEAAHVMGLRTRDQELTLKVRPVALTQLPRCRALHLPDTAPLATFIFPVVSQVVEQVRYFTHYTPEKKFKQFDK